MSKQENDDLLKALNDVNKCLFCVECHQFCKNPVTLSKCFHLICSEHFQNLSHCPKCKVALNDSTTWSDGKLNDAVDAAKNLTEMLGTSKEINSHDSVNESSAAKMAEADALLPTAEEPKQNPIAEENILNNCTLSNKPKSAKMIENRNYRGETELHIACRIGNADKVAKLLSEGANTNTKDNAGWTPLHEAVQTGRQDLVKLLLKHSTLVNVPGKGNETPLHEAIHYRQLDIAMELVARGADIDARNSKGETPLALTTPEIKALIKDVAKKRSVKQQVFDLEIVQRQIDLDSDDIRIYCLSQSRSINNKLKTLTKYHSNLHVEPKFSNKVTHLIVKAKDRICDHSIEILQGIAKSLWILTTTWVTASTEEHLESFERHEVLGINTHLRGHKFARYNKYKLLPGVFNGCHFYFHNAKYVYEKLEITKAVLSKIVTDAGGVVLRRAPNPEYIPEAEKLVPYHARSGGKLSNCSHYIIYQDTHEPLYNLRHLRTLPVSWLVKCIEHYELLEPY